MIKSLVTATAIAALCASCRTTAPSNLASEALDLTMVETNFDWGQSDENRNIKAKRRLTFCFDKGLPDVFHRPFIMAATKVNEANFKLIDPWFLQAHGDKPYICAANWSVDAPPNTAQAQIRIKPGEGFQVPSLVGYEPYKVDYESELSTASVVPDEAKGIVPFAQASQSQRLGHFNFKKLEGYQDYIFFGEISVNVLPNVTKEKLPWSDAFGNEEANISFDPHLFAMHALGHAIRLKHDEAMHPHIQELACGSFQPDAIGPEAVSTNDGTQIMTGHEDKVFKGGDDEVSQDGQHLLFGDNAVIESSKIIPVMFPYIRLGSHCRNPGPLAATNPMQRVNFTEKETEAIKASAKHKEKPAK